MKLLNVYQPYLNNLETKAVSKVLKSGWLTNGKTTFLQNQPNGKS